jgi:predicted dehydrogenase
MRKIRVGLVGFGISARVFHAPFLKAVPGYDLVAVVERSKDESIKLYPFVEVVRKIDELISVPGIDLIVIKSESGIRQSC